jgi:hypothetical protein
MRPAKRAEASRGAKAFRTQLFGCHQTVSFKFILCCPCLSAREALHLTLFMLS